MPHTELNADEAPEESGRDESDRDYWERYDYPIDFDNPSDSRAVVLGCLAPESQRVLELGCSTGVMTQVLAERGHQVTAVEIDPVAARVAEPFAHQLLVGDLDHIESDGGHLLSELEPGSFDTLIAADVLEHLRDPVGCLRRARDLVKSDGRIVLSIPNVAHGDVRLALLAGRFDYQDSGLLDRTHVQLFTLEALLEMIREVGLAPVAWKRVLVPLGGSEIEIDENLLEFGRRTLIDDPEIETYQWIVTCLDSAVAGSEVDWPDLDNGETAAAQVLAMMNLPVAHPGVVNPPAPQEIVEPTPAMGFSRHLRRVLGWCRDRLVDRPVS